MHADLECDLLIVGGGPVGLYGAYYAGFREFRTVVIDALPELGGQITAMYPEKEILDVAGFPSVRGKDLVGHLRQQAESAKPTYLLAERAMSIDAPAGGPVTVGTDAGRTITARAVILTGGIGAFAPRPLPVGNEWIGRGAEYFVPRIEDYAGREVVVVGGGDSALDWAWALAPVASSVTVVHRREQFRGHAAMVTRVRDAGVTLLTPYELAAVRGSDRIAEVDVRHRESGDVRTLPTTAVVAALGFVANIGPMATWGLTLSKRRVVVDSAMRTNLPGVFAAGDLATYEGKVPLLSVGFGEVALAVNNAAPFVDPQAGVFPGHSSGGE